MIATIFLYSLLSNQPIFPQVSIGTAWLEDKDLKFLNVLVGGLALAGAVFTIYIGQTDLEQALEDLKETKYLSHYGELDRIYFDLLTMSVDRPYLRERALRTAGNADQYAAYAYMAWNFIETIVDRLFRHEIELIARIDAEGGPDRGLEQVMAKLASSLESARRDRPLDYLAATWLPTLEQEMRLHREWWEQSDSRQFKRPFRLWVEFTFREAQGTRTTPPAPAPLQAPLPVP
ncbi:MAG TPA: hypothetical protein PK743_14155 [Luteimonas sp.]|nr:hypothetical protein [Luteimonas sp.]HRP73762.1 hypothetical protein [Luteimonas sp.]